MLQFNTKHPCSYPHWLNLKLHEISKTFLWKNVLSIKEKWANCSWTIPKSSESAWQLHAAFFGGTSTCPHLWIHTHNTKPGPESHRSRNLITTNNLLDKSWSRILHTKPVQHSVLYLVSWWVLKMFRSFTSWSRCWHMFTFYKVPKHSKPGISTSTYLGTMWILSTVSVYKNELYFFLSLHIL